MARNKMIDESSIDCVLNAANSLIDSTQDFTDSLYINNEQRDRILKLQNDIRDQTNIFLTRTNDEKQLTDNQVHYTRLFKATPILNSCEALKQIVSIFVVHKNHVNKLFSVLISLNLLIEFIINSTETRSLNESTF